jgi:hypothetical protein
MKLAMFIVCSTVNPSKSILFSCIWRSRLEEKLKAIDLKMKTKGVVAGREKEVYVEDACRERYVEAEYLSPFNVIILSFATFLGILTSCDIKMDVVNSTQIHLLWF